MSSSEGDEFAALAVDGHRVDPETCGVVNQLQLGKLAKKPGATVVTAILGKVAKSWSASQCCRVEIARCEGLASHCVSTTTQSSRACAAAAKAAALWTN